MQQQRKLVARLLIFVILLLIFALTPKPIRNYYLAYPRSLPLTLAHSRTLPLAPAHSRSLPLILMHKYRRENDKSQIT